MALYLTKLHINTVSSVCALVTLIKISYLLTYTSSALVQFFYVSLWPRSLYCTAAFNIGR